MRCNFLITQCVSLYVQTGGEFRLVRFFWGGGNDDDRVLNYFTVIGKKTF